MQINVKHSSGAASTTTRSHHKSTKHKGGGSGKGKGSITAQEILAALRQDPSALSEIANDVASALFSGGFAAEIVQAIEAVMTSGQSKGPGRLLAATVSTLSGALQGGWQNSTPRVAMVFLCGASTAVPAYVPPHLEADLATGQDVWVEPCNGNLADLAVVSIRNFTSTPAGRVGYVMWWILSNSGINSGLTSTYTLAGSHGIPANATGVQITVSFASATVGTYLKAQPGTAPNSDLYLAVGAVQVANGGCYGTGWVPLDSAGRMSLTAVNGDVSSLNFFVTGYTV